MKLFLKDHLSFIILYIITFISLPILIHQLDGIENHYSYFIFLATTLLTTLLFFRYIRRKKMYAHMSGKGLDTGDFLIHQPGAPIEKAYATQMRTIQSFFFSKDDEYKDFLQEQQLLISHAVHQMKTPLSVIQLLIQSNQLKEPRLFLEWQKVQMECNKLNFSLNQLLTYSRSTKILADLKIELFSLKGIVQEVINELKDYFIENEIYPKSNVMDNISIYSDRKWLKVVIYQLLSNAVKYGEKDSSVMIEYENGKLLIKNRGETIPESEIYRVFELFYTGAKGRTKIEATGIGLYLVKKILTTLNHPSMLYSANHETTFTIDFSRSIETAAK
ncbi:MULTISPECIES: HAMP domain-containing sensor histidine kinase [unclassified Bacillus (in: firmicutes)]|uniref:sensor histidine kinase n=1 Tax=unclassified Bacillus (in: firmicutes) TaxID=185979 RepID=UPI001BE7CE5A|nr:MULTISPECIES: HAMP domain-containing sensor histidine kinase [unclassified Bacillus (in: firmicutes)]MBT2618896.1 HAMP domain-containing histidine kinase [Bacillus sp. ISL-78]MBT2627872.1 HAMP domain-containing histidine kinase [Bacillus sp. ISL-101]